MPSSDKQHISCIKHRENVPLVGEKTLKLVLIPQSARQNGNRQLKRRPVMHRRRQQMIGKMRFVHFITQVLQSLNFYQFGKKFFLSNKMENRIWMLKWTMH